MSFFSFLRPKGRALEHPRFGKLVYTGERTWESGQAFFPPLNKVVELLIEAGPAGPDERHEQFFDELVSRWGALNQQWEPFVRDALKDWTEAATAENLSEYIDVQCIAVLAEVGADQEWEIQLWCEEIGHWPTIVMRGWTPQTCFLDG